MSNDKRVKPLLDEARELATDYNKRATEFSERIKTFQSWLRRLEFRVKAKVEFDAGKGIYRLYFTDLHGTWGLYVTRNVKRSGVVMWDSLGALEKCSVEIKVAAAAVFPELLENLIAAQREALATIDKAHTVLDDMAEKIGRFEEEAE